MKQRYDFGKGKRGRVAAPSLSPRATRRLLFGSTRISSTASFSGSFRSWAIRRWLTRPSGNTWTIKRDASTHHREELKLSAA